MQIIENYSIGGVAFSLTPEAKTALTSYLDNIQDFYAGRDSGSEIADGIEERIAELLSDHCGSGKVVGEEDIVGVIKIIGYPEQMDQAPENEAKASGGKRLFRDPKNKIIAGVCSGIASYLGIDMVLVRLAFVLFFALSLLGHEAAIFIPLCYGIMWLVMPAAKTAQDRWAMKGDDGRVDEIVRNVKRNIESAAREPGVSEFWQKFVRVFAFCFGLLLVTVGITGLVALTVGYFSCPDLLLQQTEIWEELAEEFPGSMSFFESPFIMVLVLCIAAIPLIGLLWVGIQLSFNLRSPKWHPGVVLFILWLIALVILATKFAIHLLPSPIFL